MWNDNSNGSLRLEIDTHGCTLSAEQAAHMRGDLDALTKMVENFPQSKLHVLIESFDRTNDFAVTTSLLLPGQTLVASERGRDMHAAYEQCVRVLMDEVKEYKDRLGHIPERRKVIEGTHELLVPTIDPDPGAVDAAVAAGDYAAFRLALQGYEEPLQERVRHWLDRVANADGRGRVSFTFMDVVEEVFLDAFEGYARRPKNERFGDWLARLVDPAVNELLRHPDAELENVHMIQSVPGVVVTPEG
jgi:ribosome-associated translation inhibitor RaiA